MGKDTAEGIATELVGAGLVDPHDSVPISVNLAKLLDNQFITTSAPKTITFHLVSSSFRNKDEKLKNEIYLCNHCNCIPEKNRKFTGYFPNSHGTTLMQSNSVL